MLETRSSRRRRITITPCVERPRRLTSLTGILMTVPPVEISISWSPSRDAMALARDEHDVVAARRVEHVDESVAVPELDGDDPVGLERRVVLLEARLLDHPVPGCEDEVLRLLELTGRDHRADLLVLRERQEVD